MNQKRGLACLLSAALLLIPLSNPARAAQYSDLPESHWAYSDMHQAAWMGIINGVGEGQIAPSASLSWGQYLAMLTRAFAPQSYQSAVNRGMAWDQAGLQAALEAGLLLGDDFLQFWDLSAPIIRQDVAVLLDRALPEEVITNISVWAPSAEETLKDWYLLDTQYREAVSHMVALQIIQGKSDGTFGGTDVLQRCDGSVLLVRAVKALDSGLWYQPMQLNLAFVDESGTTVGSCNVSSYVGASIYSLDNGSIPSGYTYDYERNSYYTVSSIQSQYTIAVRTLSEAERQEADFWTRLNLGEATYEDYYMQDFLLKYQGENPRKYMLLFGSQDKRRFSDQQEAAAAMTTVTIPVWHISNGQKVPATATVLVHAALAEDVKQIFTEIYNDPEQFPIHDIGGYAWRGDSATGEHNCGTAIDINSNENYQVREGVAEAGSYWMPGVDPYSIPADSSVVRIFAEHGWSWGGDAWAWDSDPTTGYHDYMHFSYMGM